MSLHQNTNAHWIWDNYFTYNNRWGNSRLKLMGGTTAEKYRTQYIDAARQNVPAQKNYWYLDLWAMQHLQPTAVMAQRIPVTPT
ncbi:hypothetical protein [Prolixibacter sp. NT017]|uniref:hypothetical protein n=1 Tax=Prolixibacter sp. NT017 TaxID=2652390 RepID=UPI0012990004|nr:hypothetical protein [Prolixibacter sp. NT017]